MEDNKSAIVFYEVTKETEEKRTWLIVENLMTAKTMKEPKILFKLIRMPKNEEAKAVEQFYVDIDDARVFAQKILMNPSNGFSHEITKWKKQGDAVELKTLSIKIRNKYNQVYTLLRGEKIAGEADNATDPNGQFTAQAYKPKEGELPSFSEAIQLSLDETIGLAKALQDEILASRVFRLIHQ